MTQGKRVVSVSDNVAYTQENIIDILQGEGYSDITVRTLRYWRSVGKLLPLHYIDGVYYYTVKDIDKIRLLAKTSSRKSSDDKSIMNFEIEGRNFQVTRVYIFLVNGRIKAYLYTHDGGLLVKELTEEELVNAFTG